MNGQPSRCDVPNPTSHTAETPRFGVNYTPSVNWFHHWLDFDLGSVQRDLDAIAALGFDHVRVFPLWPVFQPNRTLIRPQAVDQLLSIADSAAQRGLDIAVDGLQGHMSSFDFQPSWLASWHRRNMFTDPQVLAGQAEYLRTLAAALADRPNFLGMTLGNETNQFSGDPHPDPDRITPEQAEEWLRHLLLACERGAPDLPHLHCSYDAAWYLDDHPFTPAHAARLGAMTAIHSWVFNGTAQRYGTHSPATTQHAAYLIELSKAWADDPHRPVWLQEVGAPEPWVPAEHAAQFAEQTIAAALDCPDLWGITWWCSHDIDRTLADFPKHEYSLGLLTGAQETKAAALSIARTIRQVRSDSYRPPPRRTTALVIEVQESAAKRSECGPGGACFEAYMRLAGAGVRPAVVLAERIQDQDYLARRGITNLITVDEALRG
jgi:endo-1,4-beta-mannosidase